MAFPSVSVIIPAYNAQDSIGEALEAISRQGYSGQIETIVVDDGSTDGTAEKIRTFEQVRYIRQVNAGPASARNSGARAAAYEILLFTDSDCRPEPDWVEKMVAGFSVEGVGVVAGSYGIANSSAPLARFIHGEIIFRHKNLMPDFPRAFGSYNFAISRDLFESIGGFDVSFRNASGEDNDLSYKVLLQGRKIRFFRDALVAHYHQEDLARYLKEQCRHGFWRAKIYIIHPGMAAGDDYTFWKDMVEVPVAFLHVALLLWPGIWVGLAAGFLVFELGWGFLIFHNVSDAIFGGLVMWCRAFARAAGLAVGGIYFLIIYLRRNTPLKMSKKTCGEKRLC